MNDSINDLSSLNKDQAAVLQDNNPNVYYVYPEPSSVDSDHKSELQPYAQH